MKTLHDLLEVDTESPEYQRAQALTRADRELLRALIATRKAAGLSQDDVAELLGLKQPTIAAFERYDSDPKLSTLRRYAQAVGALVSHHVELDVGQIAAGEWPPACAGGWIKLDATSKPTIRYTGGTSTQTATAAPTSADSNRADFAMAA